MITYPVIVNRFELRNHGRNLGPITRIKQGIKRGIEDWVGACHIKRACLLETLNTVRDGFQHAYHICGLADRVRAGLCGIHSHV